MKLVKGLVGVLVLLCLLSLFLINHEAARAETNLKSLKISVQKFRSDWIQSLLSLKNILLANEPLEDLIAHCTHRSQALTDVKSQFDQQVGWYYGGKERVGQYLDIFRESILYGKQKVDAAITLAQKLITESDLPNELSQGRNSLSETLRRRGLDELGPKSQRAFWLLVKEIDNFNFFDETNNEKGYEQLIMAIDERTQNENIFFWMLRVLAISIGISATCSLLYLFYKSNQSLHGMVKQTSKELSQTRDVLQIKEDQLSDARYNKVLFELTVAISNEINTPLGNCITLMSYLSYKHEDLYLDFLKNEVSKSSLHDFFKLGSESFERLNINLHRMRDQINSFKKLSAHQMQILVQDLDPSQYFSTLAEELRIKAQTRGVRFSANMESGIRIKTYGENVRSMLVQLFENSMQHAFPEGKNGEIFMQVSISKKGLEIEFRDDGQGVPLESLEQLAQPFYTSARFKGNMGLGLSIIQSMAVYRLKGSFKVLRLNPGLAVYLSIPAASNQEPIQS